MIGDFIFDLKRAPSFSQFVYADIMVTDETSFRSEFRPIWFQFLLDCPIITDRPTTVVVELSIYEVNDKSKKPGQKVPYQKILNFLIIICKYFR